MPILVTIILGSKSDLPIADKVTKVLDDFEIEYDMHIASAHRTPEVVKIIIEESNSEVFIAIAGLSAALPGVIAANTLKPVIGVPVSGKLNFDSVLSMVQMPSGVPVATTSPPVSPPPGPKSIMWSADFITSKLCSITRTVLFASTRACSTFKSLSISAKCRPVVGSSSI